MSQSILITGGAQRLGLAVANNLLDQGYKVIVTYRTPRPAIQQLKNNGATLIHADFSTQEGIERAIEQIKLASSLYRAIIHNASDWHAETPDDAPHDIFSRMMQVHASAPYQINLSLKSLFDTENQFCDIIHMTDYVQIKGCQKRIAYAASKAALHNLTLSFAQLLAPRIKVNSIAPALLMFNEWDDQEYRERSLNKSILKHIPGAQEAVKAVNYLLSSEYITGETINLNGGRHLK